MRAPAIDLAEIGAGGGSLAWIDAGGALRVGPRSASAMPGPACYGLGGEIPTVTDANVVLGFLSRSHLLDGAMPIDSAAAGAAILQHVAQPLGITVHEAAHGIHAVADATMVRAVQAVTSEIGRAPGDFTMIAFGGSGPVHAASLALHAGIAHIVVPPAPGVFSAFGLLFTRIEHRLVRTCVMDADQADLDRVGNLLHLVRAEADELMRAEGVAPTQSELTHQLDLRYRGQSSEIAVPLALPLTPASIASAIQAFHHEHERSYGYCSLDEPVQIVNLRLRVRSRSGGTAAVNADGVSPALAPLRSTTLGSRRIYFGARWGWHETPVVRRGGLVPSRGPLVIEEYDTTVVVPPGARVQLDATGSIRIDLTPILQAP